MINQMTAEEGVVDQGQVRWGEKEITKVFGGVFLIEVRCGVGVARRGEERRGVQMG